MTKRCVYAWLCSRDEGPCLSVISQALFPIRAGDLERIARFWFTGACKPNKQQKSSSKPLALEQFMSTFLLLGCGILLALLLLGLEHVYFKYFRQYVARSETGTCCALLSMVSIAFTAALAGERVRACKL